MNYIHFRYNYKNHKILSLPEDEKAMIFWLDSDLKVIIQQVKAGKKLTYNPFPFKNIENNKIVRIKSNVVLFENYKYNIFWYNLEHQKKRR